MHLKLKFNYIANSLRITIIQIFLYLKAQICPADINMDFYICILDKLISEFSTRFDAGEYFDFDQNCSQYISDPYTFPIKNLNSLSQQFSIALSLLQNELIELQSETSIKSKSIIDLWKNCINYPNLQMMAARILSFFSSTYCCELTFLRFKIFFFKSTLR